MSKRDNDKTARQARAHVTRRDLIKYSIFVGAALGLPRWKVFEVLEMTGGKALAAEAACSVTNRSVHMIGGAGGFAWFQLLWPHNDVAAGATNNGELAFHAPGQQQIVQGTDKTLTIAPETPWKQLAPNRQVTALMGGTNETHTRQPTSSSTVAANTSLFASCAAVQSANPTLVPVIAVGNAPFGNAPGAPRIARVNNAQAMVELFNSAAARAGGALDSSQDAKLYETSYNSFLALHAAAGRPTMARTFATGKTAANLLGRNLADQLTPTNAELTRYGIVAGSPTKLVNIARTLITTAKAFRLGLTSMVVLPAMEDDPHGAFNDMNSLRFQLGTLGRSMDEFLKDLDVDDPFCAGSKIAQNTVISVHGDTPKTPLSRSGWPDGTPGNSNWAYVLGAGYLKSGWFGGINRNGGVQVYNPATGADTNGTSASVAMSSAAATLFAVAKGDMRKVQEFYRGTEINGIVRLQQL